MVLERRIRHQEVAVHPERRHAVRDRLGRVRGGGADGRPELLHRGSLSVGERGQVGIDGSGAGTDVFSQSCGRRGRTRVPIRAAAGRTSATTDDIEPTVGPVRREIRSEATLPERAARDARTGRLTVDGSASEPARTTHPALQQVDHQDVLDPPPGPSARRGGGHQASRVQFDDVPAAREQASRAARVGVVADRTLRAAPDEPSRQVEAVWASSRGAEAWPLGAQTAHLTILEPEPERCGAAVAAGGHPPLVGGEVDDASALEGSAGHDTSRSSAVEREPPERTAHELPVLPALAAAIRVGRVPVGVEDPGCRHPARAVGPPRRARPRAAAAAIAGPNSSSARSRTTRAIRPSEASSPQVAPSGMPSASVRSLPSAPPTWTPSESTRWSSPYGLPANRTAERIEPGRRGRQGDDFRWGRRSRRRDVATVTWRPRSRHGRCRDGDRPEHAPSVHPQTPCPPIRRGPLTPAAVTPMRAGTTLAHQVDGGRWCGPRRSVTHADPRRSRTSPDLEEVLSPRGPSRARALGARGHTRPIRLGRKW